MKKKLGWNAALQKAEEFEPLIADVCERLELAGSSRRLVTPQAFGGLMPPGFKFKDGALWKEGWLVATAEEEDVFRALGLVWIEPKDRK